MLQNDYFRNHPQNHCCKSQKKGWGLEKSDHIRVKHMQPQAGVKEVKKCITKATEETEYALEIRQQYWINVKSPDSNHGFD